MMMQISSMTTLMPSRGQEQVSLLDREGAQQKEELRDLKVLDASDVLALLTQATEPRQAALRVPIVLNKIGLPGNRMSAEAKTELIHTLSSQQQGYDMERMDRTVAGVAALYGAQLVSNALLTKGNENNKDTATTSGVGGITSARSGQALEGGTDITAPAAPAAFYSNVLGNSSILHAFVSIMKALNQQEAQANKRAAQWSQNIMSSANAAGNNLISAAEQRRTGALAGGVLGLGMTGAATALTLKGVNNQVKSINNNMKRSLDVKNAYTDTQREVKSVQDTMLKNGEPVSTDVGLSTIKNHPEMIFEERSMDNAHRLVDQDSLKIRSYSDALIQGSRMTHESIERSFDISASGSNKAAEISRANQSISGEVDNAHLQTGKRASEGESALRQSLLAILSHNNEAVAAVASRMG